MSFWLSSQLLQPLIPWPLAVNSRCDNYHTALKETSAPITVLGVLNNKFKTCSILQTKSNLVCLHRRHVEFLTKKKYYLWLLLAPCAQDWSSKPFHTASFIILQQKSPPIGQKRRETATCFQFYLF